NDYSSHLRPTLVTGVVLLSNEIGAYGRASPDDHNPRILDRLSLGQLTGVGSGSSTYETEWV
ncbi:MAG: hypothetical protein WBX25_12740, partial [Rhodomicrobium sp.]